MKVIDEIINKMLHLSKEIAKAQNKLKELEDEFRRTEIELEKLLSQKEEM